MEVYKNNFNPKLPYRVVSIETEYGLRFKIKQPLKIFGFIVNSKYIDICKWYSRNYSIPMYFENEIEINRFIDEQQNKKIFKNYEIIVFDSLNN